MGAQGGFGVSFLEDIPSPVGTTLSDGSRGSFLSREVELDELQSSLPA